jgi:hypothetical protein
MILDAPVILILPTSLSATGIDRKYLWCTKVFAAPERSFWENKRCCLLSAAGHIFTERHSGFFHQVFSLLLCFFCSGETLFSSDDLPPCANPASWGAGAHCDASALPKLEIPPR